MGTTINTMVLAGLVIAMGEVVDDAIIDVENIVRRLRQNRAEGNRRSAFDVVLAASIEVRSAVVFATLIVILVFVPVLFLEGLTGSFFRPLAMAYILAILASLLVALTVTPALSLMLLPGSVDRHRASPLVRVAPGDLRGDLAEAWSTGRAGRWRSSWRRSGRAGTRSPGSARSCLPNFKETDFLMHFVEKPGTSLAAMTRITEKASKELAGDPGRQQLRLAHRPGRGRRRGRRAELHRTLDQHRPGRPRTTRPSRRSTPPSRAIPASSATS